MQTKATKASIIADLHARWTQIQKRARTIPVPLPKTPTLLGTSLKVGKSDATFKDTLSRILYLSPAHEAFPKGAQDGRTMCKWATPECILVCLGHNSGNLAMPHSKVARIWKTTLYLGDRKAFRALLNLELQAFSRSCSKKGVQGAIRLDGSSDVGEASRWAPLFPELSFYDYSKSSARVSKDQPANWSLAFSFDGSKESSKASKRILGNGGVVAVVFDAKPQFGEPGTKRFRPADPIPSTWGGFDTFDGDRHDFIPNDPRGQVRGLRFKALADREGHRNLAGSFLQEVTV